jgi:hypothetical protein
MGMFDTISVNFDLLPISEEEKQLMPREDFQTKSLEKCLLFYRITDDGFLEYEDSADFEKDRQVLLEEGNWVRVEDIHGYVSFYVMASDRKWYEFVAKFTDGRLVKIFKNDGPRYAGNRRSDP